MRTVHFVVFVTQFSLRCCCNRRVKYNVKYISFVRECTGPFSVGGIFTVGTYRPVGKKRYENSGVGIE